MNRAGHALQVFLLATVCAGGSALAAKLDKDACAGLASELAALAATGIKADMERGPDWGRANLSADRLLTAQRVLEIEDQLEFRCSVRGMNKPKEAPSAPSSASPATIETRASQPPASGTPSAPPTAASGSAAAASRPAPTAAKLPPTTAPMALGAPAPKPPAAPAPVPPGGASASRPATPAAVGVTKSLPAAAAATVVEPGGRAKHVIAANPPSTAPVSAPAAPAVPPVTKLGPLPSAAAAVAPAQAPGPALAPGAKKPVDPAAQAARKKNQRRSSSNAYVAPGDVSPFSLPGMR